MKILHIIPSIAPVRGGPSEAILAMVQSLISQQVDTEIITTNDNGSDLLFVPLNQKTIYHNVPVWFFPRFSPNIHSLREFGFSRELTIWLWQNINNYDLVHIHAIFSYTSTVAMLIARIKNIPYIIRPLGQLCTWSLTQSPIKKELYLKIIEKRNINFSNAVHFTSEQEKKETLEMGINAPNFILPHGLYLPQIIPNAKDELRTMLNLPLDEPIILFMSRIHPKKGLDFLISALGKIKDERFTFILAGSGDSNYEKEIEEKIALARITHKTHKLGFVKGEIKEKLLQGSDIFILTSYSENFGISVLEAMANKLAVIVTPGVALSDMIKKNNIGYVTEMNVTSIAQTIQNCLKKPEEIKQKGYGAYQLISNQYSWPKIATQLIHIYTIIIKNEKLTT